MLKKWTMLVVAAMLLLAGCSSKKEEVKEHKQKEIEKVTKEPPKPEFVYPLTGVPANEEPKQRAVAVMINNHPAARPQSGLHQADLVYEILAEGDITRFLAVFQSEQPEKIGPVRSARDYFIKLTKGYEGIYIAHGWSPEAKRMLKGGFINNLNGMEYDGSLFKRSSDRVAPHNSYISYDNIQKGSKNNGFKTTGSPDSLTFLKEDELENLSGEKGEAFKVIYSGNNQFNASYRYNSESKKYERYSGGVQTADHETKKPVLLDNVFVVEMNHKLIDNYGRRDINLSSGGKGYLFQLGKWNEVEWKNVDGKILPYSNGKEVGLVRGKTWINIIPASPGLKKTVSIETD